MNALQIMQTVGIFVTLLSVVVAMLRNRRDVENLSTLMQAEFSNVRREIGSLEKLMNAKFVGNDEKLLRVEQVLDARLHSIEREISGRQ